MKKIFALTVGSLLIILSLFVNVNAAEDGASNTVTNSDIEVTVSVDKASYAAGETVNYTIEIQNDKYMWQINSLEFEYSNSEELTPAAEGSMPSEVPIIPSGESYIVEGALVGDSEILLQAAENTENSFSLTVKIVVGVVILALIIFIVFFILKKGKKLFIKGANVLFLFGLVIAIMFVSAPAEAAEYETVTMRPYVEFEYAGQNVVIRTVMEFHVLQTRLVVESDDVNNAKKITCHDPSIFKDFDGTYYLFGTHITGGYSEDLFDWVSKDSDIRSLLSDETIEQIRAWNKDGDRNENWYGYLWAPDIIYNEAMGKYCIYLSANGDDWKSNIVLLTSDTIYGEYEYAGSVVMGGFTEETYSETDVYLVTGETEIPDRYVEYGIKNRLWGEMWPNVIDPCVFYDDDGNLWMSYGSWSGGIFILELDENTGLRDYEVTYETNIHSDAYFGTKIAGGAYVSGEGSYIQKIGDYYYLFMSYGNLEAAGGYNIRVFRSESPDSGYVDELGNTPYYDTYIFNYNYPSGIRLMGGYKWRNFNYGQVAQGHNSAFVDDDGKAYIVFHTRTTNGSEAHYVKVHQLFVNKEGWLVAAPYQTDGETLKENGYTALEVAGDYELIIHNLDIDYSGLETNKPEFITLEENGTITGDYTGTWGLEPGTPYILLNFDGEEYSGVTLEMNIEYTAIETMVFTALGTSNQITIWGSKTVE